MIGWLLGLSDKVKIIAVVAFFGLSVASCLSQTIPMGFKLSAAKKEIRAGEKKLEKVNADLSDKSARLSACEANNKDLEAINSRQDASIRALKAEGDRITAQAQKAVSEARKAQASADRSATALLNYKAAGATQCERTADAIRKVREGLQ